MKKNFLIALIIFIITGLALSYYLVVNKRSNISTLIYQTTITNAQLRAAQSSKEKYPPNFYNENIGTEKILIYLSSTSLTAKDPKRFGRYNELCTDDNNQALRWFGTYLVYYFDHDVVLLQQEEAENYFKNKTASLKQSEKYFEFDYTKIQHQIPDLQE